MRRFTLAVPLAAALVLCGIPRTQADDDAWIALAGVVGGAALYSALHDGHGSTHITYRSGYAPQPTGHYEYRMETVWVTGYWEQYRAPCGTYQHVWHEGYWDHRQVKVWVAHPPPRRPAPSSYGHGSRHQSPRSHGHGYTPGRRGYERRGGCR